MNLPCVIYHARDRIHKSKEAKSKPAGKILRFSKSGPFQGHDNIANAYHVTDLLCRSAIPHPQISHSGTQMPKRMRACAVRVRFAPDDDESWPSTACLSSAHRLHRPNYFIWLCQLKFCDFLFWPTLYIFSAQRHCTQHLLTLREMRFFRTLVISFAPFPPPPPHAFPPT